jgi:hypothetical protein
VTKAILAATQHPSTETETAPRSLEDNSDLGSGDESSHSTTSPTSGPEVPQGRSALDAEDEERPSERKVRTSSTPRNMEDDSNEDADFGLEATQRPVRVPSAKSASSNDAKAQKTLERPSLLFVNI